jgi:hypothetical protein
VVILGRNFIKIMLRLSFVATAVGTAMAFQSPSPLVGRPQTSLKVVVDPTTITNKEYEDICGVTFDSETLEQRLKRTNYLYPKHVEVIEDIAPIAGAMVDEIVSFKGMTTCLCGSSVFAFMSIFVSWFVL